jgi:hypothetical protein
MQSPDTENWRSGRLSGTSAAQVREDSKGAGL